MPDLVLMNPLYGNQTWLAGNYDHFVLGKDSYIIDNPTGLIVSGAFGNRTIVVEGSIVSTNYRGIELGAANPNPNSSTQNHIVIGQEGSIASHDDSINLKALATKLTNHGTLDSKLGNAVQVEGDSFWLANYGTMTTGVRHVIDIEGDNANVINHGSIAGAGYGIFLVNAEFALVTNAGTISAANALYVDGDHAELMNSGTIQATQTGASFLGASADVVNSGTIDARSFGLSLSKGGSVSNSGTILSGSFGINAVQSEGLYRNIIIVNTGTIQGGGDAIHVRYLGPAGGNLRLLLDNQGDIVGDIDTVSTPDFAVGHSITNSGTITGDILLGGAGDTYKGGKGSVTGEIQGNGGNDTLIGGLEDNTIHGGAGDDTLGGRGGDDTLNGDAGNDTIRGGAGEDTIDGGDNNDTIRGGAGDDDIKGGNGNDDIRGGAGDDTIDGGHGRDTLHGGAGNDELNGFHQWDVLIGGKGDDVLTGGFGNDIFVFGAHDGHDRITDFVNGQDRIDLSALGLSAADYASVVAPGLSAAGATVTVLDMTLLGGTGTVRIEGLAIADADVSDFIF